MDNNNHEETKKKLKIIGFIVLGAGVILSAAGLISFFSAFGSDEFPKAFFLVFPGFPMIGIGASMLSFAYKREIMHYSKNEGVPVLNEAIEEVAPTVKKVVSDVKAESEKTADEKTAGEKTKKCPKCGAENSAKNKFCSECGAALNKACPTCGNEVKASDKFCPNCGTKLDENKD